MKLTDLTIKEFVDTTSSAEPVPGGGSISALCGTLASALSTMVARLTIDKKKYADVQDEMQQIIDKSTLITTTLQEAVNLDSQAYDCVFNAYKLPKSTDEEIKERNDAIQSALKEAAAVPLAVAKESASLMPLIETLAHKGNKNAITDAFVAALCVRATVLGASANVRINLLSITDEKFVDDTMREIIVLEHQAIEAETQIRNFVMHNI